jgi:plastocyanin
MTGDEKVLRSTHLRCVLLSGLLATAFMTPVILHAASGGGTHTTRQSPTTKASTTAATATGVITGVVRYEGPHPRRSIIPVSKDSEVCGKLKRSETYLVSPENHGLRNVLVTVNHVTGGKPSSPQRTVTVELKGCRHVPHFQVVEVGRQGIELVVLNEDGILHNVHAYQDGETLFNVAQPGFRRELRRKLTTPGIVTLRCDVHRWMGAYIVLLKDNPYYDVTDKQGRFSIPDVPPGSYTLRAWHEALGEMEKRVTVRGGHETEVELVVRRKGGDGE